jgi:hypothetical protein
LAQFSTGWRFPAALNVSNTPGKLLGRRRLAAATGVGTTISVNRPNDHTAVVTTKRNGEIRSTSTRTVSSDGKRLTEVTEAKGVAGPIRNTRVYANTVEIILNSPTVPPATRRMQAKGNTLVVTTTGTGPGGKPYNDVAFYERQN